MRYRDLLVATLSLAICEMQVRSATLFGFVIAIERQCAQKSGRRCAPRAERRPLTEVALGLADRAHHIQSRLIQNPKLTVHDIAREEQVSAAYLYTLLRLPWLAPDITTAIINGRKPPQLTAQTLMRLTPRLPAGWAEQRKLLGFR